MISEERMSGYIDQIACIVHFGSKQFFIYSYCNIFLTKLSKYLFLEPNCLPSWDKQMQTLCTQVNTVIEKIQQADPEWAKLALASKIN